MTFVYKLASNKLFYFMLGDCAIDVFYLFTPFVNEIPVGELFLLIKIRSLPYRYLSKLTTLSQIPAFPKARSVPDETAKKSFDVIVVFFVYSES